VADDGSQEIQPNLSTGVEKRFLIPENLAFSRAEKRLMMQKEFQN